LQQKSGLLQQKSGKKNTLQQNNCNKVWFFVANVVSLQQKNIKQL